MRVLASFASQMLDHHRKLQTRAFSNKLLFVLLKVVEKVLFDMRVASRKPIEPPF